MATVKRAPPGLLRREGTGLILIDVQEAFRPVIDGFDRVVADWGSWPRASACSAGRCW